MNSHFRLVEKIGLSTMRMVAVFTVALLVCGCTTVSKEEKARVLDKILQDGRLSAEEEALLNEQSAPEQEKVEPEPVKEPAVSEKAKSTPAPALQKVARLPLPRGVNHSDLVQFMNAHAEVLSPYQPFLKEWHYYARTFADGASANELELKTMRMRIREDFPRAHWLFTWGLQQSSFMLLDKTGSGTFLIDRQQDFLGHMSVLLFLATELQTVSGRPEYRETLKRFYKNANTKYFKRPLTDRPAKPESLLRPQANPTEVKAPAPARDSD